MVINEAVQRAAEALQRISESTAGERGRRAGAVALVLRAVERLVEGGGAADGEFVTRRAELEIARIPGGEGATLSRLLAHAAGGDVSALVDALVGYACDLEAARRLEEADAVISLGVTLAPDSAEVTLHAGRVARMQGDRERALALYRRARELDVSGTIGRLAGIGEVVVSEDAECALSSVGRRAVREGDMEAAAVALEERARLRRSDGRRGAAVRDLCVAAARFPDPVDSARVAHAVADLCVAAGDPAGAREALLAALAVGDSSQRDHATSRLHTISRDVGDRVGMRRWRSFERPPLVSLSVRPSAASGDSLAPSLKRWRARLEAWLR